MYVEVQCKDLSITKDWDIVEKRRKRACFFHCNIFVDQDQKELEKGEMTQDCCHYTVCLRKIIIINRKKKKERNNKGGKKERKEKERKKRKLSTSLNEQNLK
eukprot:Phypoly_transcript_19970.p1 GENE.Phypoly_transcript_19970~~Phypoly_transcript_19970.p1  ORF type:complete len:102 (+),score=18.78 Phypoly_transcript_19970:311-616(+)